MSTRVNTSSNTQGAQDEGLIVSGIGASATRLQDSAILAGEGSSVTVNHTVNHTDAGAVEQAFKYGQILANLQGGSFERLVGGAEVLFGKALIGQGDAYDKAGQLMASAVSEVSGAYDSAGLLMLKTFDSIDKANTTAAGAIQEAFRTADQKLDPASLQKLYIAAGLGVILLFYMSSRRGKQ